MKVLIIGVDTLPNYTNKKSGQADPSVIIHLITKSDNGFKSTKRPAFLSCSDPIFDSMLKKCGSVDKAVGYYAIADYNESGFIEDLSLVEPSGVNIPWKI